MNYIEDTITLLYIDINEFRESLYLYYIDIFPEDERKSLDLLKSSYNRGYTKIIKIQNNDILVGFMILNQIKNNGYAVLDYFAILPQYRNKNFGTRALEALINENNNFCGIFAEVEKVGLGIDEKENFLRERRKQFYERLGFEKLHFDLFLFDVVYMPYLFSRTDFDEDFVIDKILDIYKSIAGEERINKNCKFIKLH